MKAGHRGCPAASQPQTRWVPIIPIFSATKECHNGWAESDPAGFWLQCCAPKDGPVWWPSSLTSLSSGVLICEVG